jgi:hypothetical protein
LPPNRFRTGYVASAEDGAELTFAKVRTRRWTVHYTPAPEAIRIAKQANETFSPPSKPILLIEGDLRTDVLVLHPINTTATSSGFLESKYGKLRTITLEGFRLSEIISSEEVRDALQSLPPGFVKDPFLDWGSIGKSATSPEQSLDSPASQICGCEARYPPPRQSCEDQVTSCQQRRLTMPARPSSAPTIKR